MMDESASTSNNNTVPPTRRQKDRLELINEDHLKLLKRLEEDYHDSFPEGIKSYKAQGYLYEVTREPNESVNDWIERRLFEIEYANDVLSEFTEEQYETRIKSLKAKLFRSQEENKKLREKIAELTKKSSPTTTMDQKNCRLHSQLTRPNPESAQ